MVKALKQLHLIERNWVWWQGSQKISQKLLYYPELVLAYLKLIVRHDRSISYLGCKLEYDNAATPLSLMYYPHEISQKILANTTNQIKNVLDIGGNIGQFSITFNQLKPNIKIDSFEPNREAFKLFQKNIQGNKNIRIFNYGIGPKGSGILHFMKNRSATASLIRDNAFQNTTDTDNTATSTKVNLIDNIPSITEREYYDLIKIDVEGFEFQVVKQLNSVKCKYLFIEVSGQGRTKDFYHSQLFNAISQALGEYDILEISGEVNDHTRYDLLLQFKESHI